MKLRTVIVDDELPAREMMATLLRDEPEVEVVAECNNGKEALEVLRRGGTDLLFLDVQMPGLNGFDVLEGLTKSLFPRVIFVTAFQEHAVRAFEFCALDYLLKPFAYDRVREAVRRAREAGRPGIEYVESARQIRDVSRSLSSEWDRLVVRDGGRLVFVRPQDVDWIEAEGNYVRLHAGMERHLLRQTLQEIEKRLASRGFLRLSRFTLVNIDRIKESRPLFHGEATVILQDGTKLTLTRTVRESFDRLVASFERSFEGNL
jgi:two-component system LytT family response regulator